MKIIFKDSKLNKGIIQISLNGGVTYEEYKITDVLESGISLNDDQDLSLIKIKGPANILRNAEVISSIKVGDIRGIIFSNGILHYSDSYKDLTTIDIKSGTTEIGPGAFNGCLSLTGVTIPDTVTSISKNAFQDCSNLANINIPDSVTYLGDGAFMGCSNLAKVTLGDGLCTVSNFLFCDCVKLKYITFGDNIRSIGEVAFSSTGIIEISLPEGVTNIGAQAFYDSVELREIIFILDGQEYVF